MITFTDRAVKKVRMLIENGEGTEGFGLRVGVTPGGCAGYEYSLALEAAPVTGDIVVDQDGFDVYVSEVMAPLLNGIQIDYVESLASSGFTFANPNAGGGCGCGNSFSATEAAEQSAADVALRSKVEETMADIRPFLQGDGGDVTIVGVTDGVVTVQLTGACGLCSMSAGTLTGVIEKRLRDAIPDVQRVVLAGRH